MQLSVVIPVRNEADNILPLLAEIQAALAGLGESEVVYVDDGSSDATPQRLAEAMRLYPNLRVLRHASSCGQSTALLTGVRAARGEWIATLDGDGQNDPADIPKLLAARDAAAAGATPWLVAGYRQEAPGQLAEALFVARRERGALAAAGGCDAGHGLRPEAGGARDVPAAAVLRPHAPLPAGAGAARGRHDGVGGGEPPAAHARRRRTTACSTGCGSASSTWWACCGCSAARSGPRGDGNERELES